MLPINIKETLARLERLERLAAQVLDEEVVSIEQTQPPDDDWPRPGPGEEFLPTGGYYVRRVRGRRAPMGTALWTRRFNIWRRFGFTTEEATWAAEHNLSLNDPYIKDIQRARFRTVQAYMEDFNLSFEEAVRRQADILARKNQRYREAGENIYNVFREISP